MSLALQHDGDPGGGAIGSVNNDKSDAYGEAGPSRLEEQQSSSSATTITTTTPAAKRIKLNEQPQQLPGPVGITPEPTKCQRCCGADPAVPVAEMKELLQRETGYNSDDADVVRKRQDYIDWDTYFMATAVLSSLRSKDPHHGSGCCIVDQRKRIIGIGYNGFPMGASDDVLPWKKPSDHVPILHTYEPYVVHAVINAILCSGDVQGATLFVTEFPTAECAKAIIQAGISEVVYNDDSREDAKASDSHKASGIMFQMAGIKMRKFVASTRSSVELVRTGEPVETAPVPRDKPATDSLTSELESHHRMLLKKEAGLEDKNSGKRLDYLSWDDYFLWMAFLTAQRSKDPNTQVGACVVLNKRIVGLGYNGFPLGCSDDLLPWSRKGKSELHTKYPYVCHAEVNAVMNRIFPNIRGASLYVALFPCNECAKFIIQAGIQEVVFLDDKYHDTDICRASRILFGMAGVKLRQHTPTDVSLKLQLAQIAKNKFGT